MMIRTTAASVADFVTGRLDVIPTDVIPADVIPTDVIPADVIPTNVIPTDVIPAGVSPANEADVSEDDDFDEAKCVVGAGRTYCHNCRRYHHALVPQN